MESGKIRFAENLASHVVTVEGRVLKIHCLGWNVLRVHATPEENIEELRRTVHDLIKGTPADINSVHTLLEIAL